MLSSPFLGARRVRALILFLLAVSCLPKVTWALVVNADIAVDTIWTLADSPVTVTDTDFRVNNGVTLTINPGVTVLFAGVVSIYGTLNAVGTAVSPITFDEINAGDKWGYFKVSRAGCGDAHNHSVLSYVDMLSMESYIYVDRQSLTIDNATIDIETTTRYGIISYNNNAASCPGASLQFDFTNNAYTFTTSYTGGGLDKVLAINVDGVNSTFSGNTITTVANGAPYMVFGLYMDISNTDDFVSVIDDNFFTVIANDDATTYTVGVIVADYAIDVAVTDNIVNVAAPRIAYGLWLGRHNASGNQIMVDSSYSGFIGENSVYGIYSESTGSTTEITDNKVTLTSPDDRLLTGIFCQAGTISGNRLIISLSGSAGSAHGFGQQYYDATIENNSVKLSAAAGLTVVGAYFGTKYAGAPTILKNNIFQGNGQAGATGVYKDTGYAGEVAASYNLVYNFAATYGGLSAGAGNVYSDPLFSNVAELTLSSSSPALDKGDWASAYANEPQPNGGRVDIGAFGNSASSGTTTVAIVAPEISTNGGANFTANAVAVTIEGSTSTSSNSVWVNNATSGVSYTPGQINWSYTGTLAAGTNSFSVLAKNGGGQSSVADTIQVTYNPPAPPNPSTITDEGSGDAPSVEDTGNYSEAGIDESVVTGSDDGDGDGDGETFADDPVETGEDTGDSDVASSDGEPSDVAGSDGEADAVDDAGGVVAGCSLRVE